MTDIVSLVDEQALKKNTPFPSPAEVVSDTPLLAHARVVESRPVCQTRNLRYANDDLRRQIYMLQNRFISIAERLGFQSIDEMEQHVLSADHGSQPAHNNEVRQHLEQLESKGLAYFLGWASEKLLCHSEGDAIMHSRVETTLKLQGTDKGQLSQSPMSDISRSISERGPRE